MPGVMNFDIRGAREMERLLEALGPRVAARVGDQALRAAAKPIAAEARRRVPVRTGALRASIVVVTPRRRRPEQRAVFIGFAKPTSRRAHLTEFGTRHSAAQPFLRPALDAQAGAALDEMGRVLARGIEREALKLAKR